MKKEWNKQKIDKIKLISFLRNITSKWIILTRSLKHKHRAIINMQEGIQLMKIKLINQGILAGKKVRHLINHMR